MSRHHPNTQVEELRRENDKLFTHVINLTREVQTLRKDLKELSATHPETMLAQQEAAVEKWLDDPEMVESCRQCAWIKEKDRDRYWDDAKGDYDFPEGYPGDFTAELAIAEVLGLDLVLRRPTPETMTKVFGAGAPKDKEKPGRTFLHQMLDEARNE